MYLFADTISGSLFDKLLPEDFDEKMLDDICFTGNTFQRLLERDGLDIILTPVVIFYSFHFPVFAEMFGSIDPAGG